jgi:hypothetical protein
MLILLNGFQNTSPQALGAAAYPGHKQIIFIGSRGQDAFRPYLLRPAESYCFCPAENERKRRAELHDRRPTPMSCGDRPGTNRKQKPKKTPGDCYTSCSYVAAVHHAIIKANKERAKQGIENRIPSWHPMHLRKDGQALVLSASSQPGGFPLPSK